MTTPFSPILPATTDFAQRFHIESAGVRGVLVRLDSAWQRIRGADSYPAVVADTLGAVLAASALFAGEIKLARGVSVQLKSRGPLSLVFAECTDRGQLRGVARYDERAQSLRHGLEGIGSDALLAITIENPATEQRHQGLVPLDAPSLDAAFESYFARSEQLPTAIKLAIDGARCAGMLVQQIAAQGGQSAADPEFERVAMLFRTLTDRELLELDPTTLLRRLFAEDDVRLHPPQPLAFGCRCSRDRVAGVLRQLGEAEMHATLAEQGRVEVRCEFCNAGYVFDRVDIAALFADAGSTGATPTQH
jgi:molecular chaperone Hsp33